MSQSPAIDPKDIFIQAEAFALSAKRLNDIFFQEKNFAIGPVMHVNRAFAVELYLKCLLMLDGKKPWGHEIQGLFNDLLPTTQNAIKTIYRIMMPEHRIDIQYYMAGRRIMGLPPESFEIDDALRRANNTFTNSRYLFEGKSIEGSDFTIHIIERAARAHIAARQPNWLLSHSLMMHNYILVAPAPRHLTGEEPPKDLAQYIITACCPNGKCQEQISLVFNMEQGIEFPTALAGGPPLIAYPATDIIECSACQAHVDYRAVKQYIESYTGSTVCFST